MDSAVAQLELDLSSWTIKALDAYIGGLSDPSKMPGYAFSLPAKECRTGSKLRTVAGSVCHGCYAMKGRYVFPIVEAAMYRRLGLLTQPHWAEAIAELINRRASKHTHFRWHDSGDLQSVEHLAQICRAAELSPTVAHWLPTREYRTVRDYLAAGGTIPPNLNVRMSAHMLGGVIPRFPRLPVTVSTVTKGAAPKGAHSCPAPQQGNVCGSCRACWDRTITVVNYHYH
jgi:hypothetical protein